MHRVTVASLALVLWTTTASAQSSPPALPALPAPSATPSAEPAPSAPPPPSTTLEGAPAPPSAPPTPPSTATPPAPAPEDAPVHADAASTEPTPPCPCGPFVHRGFYLMFGSGAAHVATFGDGPSGSASISGLGSTAHVAIGGTIGSGFALAGVIQAAARSGSTFNGGPAVTLSTTKVVNGQPQTTTNTATGNASTATVLIGLQADWFPKPEDGWHVGASLGFGGTSVTDDASNGISGLGVAGSLFGGYQWWLGPSWSLGVSAVVMGASKANLKDSHQNDSGYSLGSLSGGLEAVLLYY